MLTGLGFLICVTSFSIVYSQQFIGKIPQKEESTVITYPEQEESSVSFLAVGDIMLSRSVAEQSQKNNNHQWAWENISDFLEKYDFVIGNLESPTDEKGSYSGDKNMVFHAPIELINTLGNYWFQILNLANNHAMDQWESGLFLTKNLLGIQGIKTTGVGENQEEAWKPSIIEKDGIRIAFFWANYSSYNDNGSGKNDFIARMQDTEMMQNAIKNITSQVDYIVVMMHAGQEYTYTTTNLQESFAKAAIEAGANLIIGSHPHWVQRIEKYQSGYIFYSLGNFIFDQEFSQETKSGLAVEITIKKESDGIKDTFSLHPITIENYGQPRLANEEEKIRILSSINQEVTTFE